MPKRTPKPLTPEAAASFPKWLLHGSHRLTNSLAFLSTIAHAVTSTVVAYCLKGIDGATLFTKLRIVLFGAQAAAIGIMLCTVAFVLRPPHRKALKSASIQADYFYRRWLWLWGVWMLLYFGLFAFYWGRAPQAIAKRRLEWQLEQAYDTAAQVVGHQLRAEALSTTPRQGLRDSLDRLSDDLAHGRKAHVFVPLTGWVDGALAKRVDSLTIELRVAARQTPLADRWTQAIFDTLNNVQTFLLLLCFFWLDRATKRIDDDLNMEPLTVGVIAVIVLAFAEYAVVMSGDAGKTAGECLRWVSGIASGMALAFLVERICGAITGTPRWVMMALMGYAIIQAAWGAFEDNAPLMLVLTSLALLLKLLLFLAVAWLLDTGVLLFYYDKRYGFAERVPGGLSHIEHDRVLFVSDYFKDRESRNADDATG